MEDGGGTGPHIQRRWDMDWVLSQIGALASDQTRSEGRTGEDRRIQPESGAKTVYSFRMMGDTLVECCHADSNQKDTPCQVPGTGRKTSETGRFSRIRAK